LIIVMSFLCSSPFIIMECLFFLIRSM
jgi:hypothetical protein